MKLVILCLGVLFFTNSLAQPLHRAHTFTRQDTLRGSITKERMGWDVMKYDLTVAPDYNQRTIQGSNTITYHDIGVKTMQIDLQEPMQIDSIIAHTEQTGASDAGKKIAFWREGNVYHVSVRDSLAMYKIKPGPRAITVFFSGKPRQAVNPPWDGGWIWTTDSLGRPWMTVACQGLGASVWYPCKDHQSDEPDSTSLTIIVPDSLVAVGNGRLKSKRPKGNGTTAYTWVVKNPINNYNIVPYIGKYVTVTDSYAGEKGTLEVAYWVLDYNREKAKEHIRPDAHRTLKALEHWFGPYPFYEDSYKIVETPHLGMEHQSAIAYGNNYQMGYSGSDLSGTGWGLKWDYLIIHESGHEWFGNNITAKDIADMWIQEGFTTYSETLFTEYYYGKEAANAYIRGTRMGILNDRPIIGTYGVNQEGSTDMYCKAANMLHLIRQKINDDGKFRSILRGLNKDFYHQTVTTKQVEDYINKKSGMNFSKIFDHYLRSTQIPSFE